MDTYRISENWSEFLDSFKSQIEAVAPEMIGFLYRKDEIFIKTSDAKLLSLIGSNYILINCNQTILQVSKRTYWNKFGNVELFGLLNEGNLK